MENIALFLGLFAPTSRGCSINNIKTGITRIAQAHSFGLREFSPISSTKIRPILTLICKKEGEKCISFMDRGKCSSVESLQCHVYVALLWISMKSSTEDELSSERETNSRIPVVNSNCKYNQPRNYRSSTVWNNEIYKRHSDESNGISSFYLRYLFIKVL